MPKYGFRLLLAIALTGVCWAMGWEVAALGWAFGSGVFYNDWWRAAATRHFEETN